LIAAVAIFVSGAAFSVWEGVRTIVGGNEPLRHAWVNYAVLLVAFVLEGRRSSGPCTTPERKRTTGGDRRAPTSAGLDEIFIQPVPREDPELRARVMRRYGRSLAD
jgi:hypothetical protein